MEFGSRMMMVATLVGCLAAATQADELKKNFATPPAEARPWVYWFNVSGNLTREGITADLEAMARVGIGGVLFFDVDQGAPKGKALYAESLWRELIQHACKEAARLGLEVNMNNGPGWCGSGGPWITPEQSMQKVVWSETIVEAGKKTEVALPQSKDAVKYNRAIDYRDIAVLAMPLPQGDGVTLAGLGAKITTSGTMTSPDCFKLRNPGKNGDKQPEFVQFEFPTPFTAYSLKAKVGRNRISKGELQVSDDGEHFKPVDSFMSRENGVDMDLAPVTARFFRIAVSKLNDATVDVVELSDITLASSYRIAGISTKACFATIHRDMKAKTENEIGSVPANFPAVPAGMAIPCAQITDITAQMDAKGKLVWEAPSLGTDGGTPRRWLVLRFGCTTMGTIVHPAPVGGAGLECDKLSKAAATFHFEQVMGKLIADNKALCGPGKPLVATHIDSWESGSQNWTPLLREDFKRLRGYDLWRYLPVLTGRVVESLEVSERFLWDFRQTLSDLLLENYVNTLRKLANDQGLRLSIEAYDRVVTDDLAYGGRADEPMAEFWAWNKYHFAFSATEMASSAHTYGKKIVGAESFTSHNGEKWQSHPATIKDLGDWAFCEGINRFVFHRFSAQPWGRDAVAPGIQMGPWGLHYERTQTWWEQSKPWHEYVARCQYLLRQGLFVADVLYLQPEGAPRSFTPPNEVWAAPNVRGGYNFDGCNSEVLLTRLAFKNGRLVLPDGMSYRVLVVPRAEKITLPVLRKLSELADAGATIIADAKPPVKSLGLADLGEGDATVKKLASELWPKLVTGKTAAQWLGEHGIKPDFTAQPLLRYIHRATADTDLYFVANTNQVALDAVAEFRITGKQPELWWPDTGRTELARDFEIKNGITRIPLRLDPSGSLFVIFREPTKVTKGTGKNWVETNPVQELVGPWEVSFDPKWGGPAKPVTFSKLQDWSKHRDPGIKYYSGHATYRTKFNARKGRSYLDLGKVAIMADVTLNGKSLGILWKPPYRVDVSDVINDGENTLEVTVVNLWINRMIGDELLPEDTERNRFNSPVAWPQWLLDGKPSPTGRYTFTTHPLWKKNNKPVESGLLGPVKLEIVK